MCGVQRAVLLSTSPRVREAVKDYYAQTPPKIASVILEKLKISVKQQVAVARDVDRVGAPEALAALRATLKVEQQGGRMDAEGKRMKRVQVWRVVLEAASKQAA